MSSNDESNVEKIIGFDAREMWMSTETHWSRDRREQYLLRLDIQKPLSVDPLVWSSIFYNIYDEHIESASDTYDPLVWTHLSKLKAHLEVSSLQRKYWIIALTCIGDANWYASVSPIIIDQNWVLLGYDIATTSLTSGLLNSGYTKEEQRKLNSMWGGYLNKYHLFADRSHAEEFRAVTDDRVPEHTPFFVYGLYVKYPKIEDECLRQLGQQKQPVAS